MSKLNWFENNLSLIDLKNIFSDLHYEKFGIEYFIEDAGRCAIARALEQFGSYHEVVHG